VFEDPLAVIFDDPSGPSRGVGVIRFRAVVLLVWWVALSPAGSAYPANEPGHARSPQTITWSSGTAKWKGQWGRRETLLCPSNGHVESVWGTDVYTDDSSVCSAAVHAGLISPATGGPVTIEVRPDHSPYHGTTRNGIRSRTWTDPWPGSFTFIWGPALAAPAPAIQATGATQVESWRGQTGRIVTLLCPPKFELHTVYGTDVYTGDSYVCTAAVHAGVIEQATGGMLTIKILEGQVSYAGSTRNGITSMSTETFPGSFTFVATPPNTPPPPTETTPFSPPPMTAPAGQPGGI
jgi:hypothetical protein